MDSRLSHNKSGARSTLKHFSVRGKPAVPDSPQGFPALNVRYVQAEELSQVSQSELSHVLAVIGYGSGIAQSMVGTVLCPAVNLPPLKQPTMVEVWESSTPVFCDQVQDIRLAFTDDAVFGSLEVIEQPGSVLEDVARAAYEQILEYCMRSGYSHLLRMWNYFPNINADQHGLERYKRFCVGRHQAFSGRYQEFQSHLPAASAVGTSGGKFQVLFLAGSQSGLPIENPRQISAYAYPQIYGPKSPSFARATLYQTSSDRYLFVAGTASIVGHATQHHGDPIQQTRETVSNIETILNRVRHERPERGVAEPSQGLLKVFVRHQDDVPIILQTLEDHELGQGAILSVQADMCRKELLVEIEGIWNWSL